MGSNGNVSFGFRLSTSVLLDDFSVRNSNCGKGAFSQVSVCPQGEGGVHPRPDPSSARHIPPRQKASGQTPPWAEPHPGQNPPPGRHRAPLPYPTPTRWPMLRMVRILLERILVLSGSSPQKLSNIFKFRFLKFGCTVFGCTILAFYGMRFEYIVRMLGRRAICSVADPRFSWGRQPINLLFCTWPRTCSD